MLNKAVFLVFFFSFIEFYFKGEPQVFLVIDFIVVE